METLKNKIILMTLSYPFLNFLIDGGSGDDNFQVTIGAKVNKANRFFFLLCWILFAETVFVSGSNELPSIVMVVTTIIKKWLIIASDRQTNKLVMMKSRPKKIMAHYG